MPYRFWKIPENKSGRIGYFAAITVILLIAVYSTLSFFCAFYIVDGEDLADGRPWRRYAIIPKSHWRNERICPDMEHCGLTLFISHDKPAPEYQYYQLRDPRPSSVYTCGGIRSFWGKSIANRDTFGWDEYYHLREELGTMQLPSLLAKRLHKKMIDIYHSGLDDDGRLAATRKLLKEFTLPETTTAP